MGNKASVKLKKYISDLNYIENNITHLKYNYDLAHIKLIDHMKKSNGQNESIMFSDNLNDSQLIMGMLLGGVIKDRHGKSLDPKFDKAYDNFVKFRDNYNSACVRYMLLSFRDRENLFKDAHKKRIDELTKDGLFLFYLDNLYFNEDILLNPKKEKLLYEQLNEELHYRYKYMIENGIFVTNEIDKRIKKDFASTLENFFSENYNACARTLFSLLEFEHRLSSSLDEMAKSYARANQIDSLVNDLNVDEFDFSYYIDAWQIINEHFKTLNLSSQKWNQKFINRNALMHGIYDRETTAIDCIKLFTLYFSFKEISRLLQNINDTGSQLSMYEQFEELSSIDPYSDENAD